MLGKSLHKFLLLAVVMLATSVSALAQHTPGSWRILPMSGEFFDNVIDTPSHVYYITGGSLYSYDKQYNETVYHTPGSRISDSGIRNMYYNVANHYLLLAYENGNIDLIYDDGTVVNLPEIKDANLTSSKTINCVSFANNHIYVATDFGIVVYDDQKHQVTESANFATQISHAFATDKYLLIISNRNIYASPIEERHNTLDKFTLVAESFSTAMMQQVKDNIFLTIAARAAGIGVCRLTIDVENANLGYYVMQLCPYATVLQPYKDGFYCVGQGVVNFISADAQQSSTVSLSTDFTDQRLALWEGMSQVWAADNNGIASYDLSDPATPTVLSEKFQVESSRDFSAAFVTYSPNGEWVYVTPIGMSEYHPAGDSGWSQHLPFICERYNWSTGKIEPMYPYGVRNTSKQSQTEADIRNSKYFYGGNGPTALDPTDPDYIYHANNFEGLIVIKDRQVLYEYNTTNSPFVTTWNARVEDANIDPNGNLWVGTWGGSKCVPPYRVLPAEKLAQLRQDPSSIAKTDWLSPVWPASETGKCDMRTIFSTHSNKMLYVRGGWGGPYIGYDTKGTTDTADDTYSLHTSLVDQDGNIITPTFRTALAEDQTGNIWIGTNTGVYVLTDLTQLGTSTSDQLAIRRPKVPRNDGTSYADYLLASETILSIAVDPSNRKWIATNNSGVYLVNEDGTEILQQFTKDNSPLISNSVYVVACDPNGNDVLICTPEGWFVYSSTSAPAADDYSNVYAFPNPVRPDYTGWITVNGLMDNSLVKIADMQGNVFWQGQSEGGMVVWDGCNADGTRVRSGVYLVLASQSADDSTLGTVAKIVVIN